MSEQIRLPVRRTMNTIYDSNNQCLFQVAASGSGDQIVGLLNSRPAMLAENERLRAALVECARIGGFNSVIEEIVAKAPAAKPTP